MKDALRWNLDILPERIYRGKHFGYKASKNAFVTASFVLDLLGHDQTPLSAVSDVD